ncbi:MAG: TenA family protein, partial [Pseudomonadota bacterium]
MKDHAPTDLTFKAFKAQHADNGFADWLRAANQERWDQMIGHRFVNDITSDRMPVATLLRYLQFEHAFVRTAITIFGQALVKAPSFQDQVHLIGVLHGLASGQDTFFARAFQTLAPTDDQTFPDDWPDGAHRLSRDSQTIAESGSYEDILSMMLAAEWMYL